MLSADLGIEEAQSRPWVCGSASAVPTADISNKQPTAGRTRKRSPSNVNIIASRQQNTGGTGRTSRDMAAAGPWMPLFGILVPLPGAPKRKWSRIVCPVPPAFCVRPALRLAKSIGGLDGSRPKKKPLP